MDFPWWESWEWVKLSFLYIKFILIIGITSLLKSLSYLLGENATFFVMVLSDGESDLFKLDLEGDAERCLLGETDEPSDLPSFEL